MDAASAKTSFELSKEIIRGLLWLFNRREIARSDVMKNEISPLYEAMKSNHEDFRYILGRLNSILVEINENFARRENDFDAEISRLEELMKDLSDRRDQRRSERPTLRAAARSYADRVHEGDLAEKLKFSGQEVKNAVLIFETIGDYFTKEDGRFGHDLRHYLERTYFIIRRVKVDGANDEIVKRVAQMRKAVQKYSEDREERWREIAEAFGVLSSTLHASR